MSLSSSAFRITDPHSDVGPSKIISCVMSLPHFDGLALRDCAAKAHAAIAKIWPTDNDKVAQLGNAECCMLASDYTESWGPPASLSEEEEGINLLVLAESHANTDSQLMGQPCVLPMKDDGMIAAGFGLGHLGHIGHLNVVHCLSYGEAWMLPRQVLENKDLDRTARQGCQRGTPQFWRALAALAGYLDFDHEQPDCDPLLGAEDREAKDFTCIFAPIEGTANINSTATGVGISRIKAKLDIKRKLQQRRILLADVSPVPIYSGGGCVKRTNLVTGKVYSDKTNRLDNKIKAQVIKTAFDEYAQFVIQRYRPRYVLVLGVSVQNSITLETLQNTTRDNNGVYLGCVQHPSYNYLQGRSFAAHLRLLRCLAGLVQKPPEMKRQTEIREMMEAFCRNEKERISQRVQEKQNRIKLFVQNGLAAATPSTAKASGRHRGASAERVIPEPVTSTKISVQKSRCRSSTLSNSTAEKIGGLWASNSNAAKDDNNTCTHSEGGRPTRVARADLKAKAKDLPCVSMTPASLTETKRRRLSIKESCGVITRSKKRRLSHWMRSGPDILS